MLRRPLRRPASEHAADDEDASQDLGHTNTRVTSSVYRHRTTPVVEAAVTTLDRLFGRPEDL